MKFRLTAAIIAAHWMVLPAQAAEPTPAEQALIQKYKGILAQLHPVSGDVAVPGADAVLHLGKDYYFLDFAEAKLVLTDGWGNPKDAVDGVLGLVFPMGKTFVDDTWGAVLTFEPSGYVPDDDAKSADYAKNSRDVAFP